MAYGPQGSAHGLARGLGWFSLGLGLVELLAARRLAAALGMRERAGLIQLYGLREIATGVGLLTGDDPTPWLWARAGGDVLDLATLAPGLDRRNPCRQNVALALAAVAGVAALDVACARQVALERRRMRWVPPPVMRDYRGRSGFPRTPEAMRGAARDFEVPRDMRTPEALRPYATA